MRTLIIGDTHCLPGVFPVIDSMLEDTGAGRVILLGDYMDEWRAGTAGRVDMAGSLAGWVGRSRRDGIIVDPLLGNHDVIYRLGDRHPGVRFVKRMAPGFDPAAMRETHRILAGVDGMKMTATLIVRGSVWLCSHAGVTGMWLRRAADLTPGEGCLKTAETINRMDDWSRLYMFGAGRGGGCAYASPLCADLTELAADPAPGLRQIVGHTPVPTPMMISTSSASMIFTDTMSRTPEGVPMGDGMWLLADDEGDDGEGSLAPGLSVIGHPPIPGLGR